MADSLMIKKQKFELAHYRLEFGLCKFATTLWTMAAKEAEAKVRALSPVELNEVTDDETRNLLNVAGGLSTALYNYVQLPRRKKSKPNVLAIYQAVEAMGSWGLTRDADCCREWIRKAVEYRLSTGKSFNRQIQTKEKTSLYILIVAMLVDKYGQSRVANDGRLAAILHADLQNGGVDIDIAILSNVISSAKIETGFQVTRDPRV